MAKNSVMEELQQIVKDLAKSQQKTEKDLAKGHQKLLEAQQKTEKGLMELRETVEKQGENFDKSNGSIKELKESIKKQGENFDKSNGSIKELKESIKKQGENLDKANGGFKDKWGSFVENLVKGTLVSLLKSKGIAVTRLIPNYEVNDENLQPIAEFDLIAANGEEMVVVEVKSTLTNDKVDAFVRKIEKFDKSSFPTYQKGKKIYGAMAYMEIYERTKRAKKRKQVAGEDSGKRAARKGLLLIEAPGGDVKFAKVANSDGFEPREF